MTQPPDASTESRARIITLTDGLFAIAMTLIVLEIRLPEAAEIQSDGQLLSALLALTPRFLAYGLSFLTLTIFWFGHQAQHEMLERSDRRLATLNLVFLGLIALLPFATGLLAEFYQYRVAIVGYWLNLLLLGLALFACWHYAVHNQLVRGDITTEAVRSVYVRIVKAQILWAFGTALCIIHPLLSLGFLLVVQLTYAAAPTSKLWRLLIG